jgi:hypothetical protein
MKYALRSAEGILRLTMPKSSAHTIMDSCEGHFANKSLKDGIKNVFVLDADYVAEIGKVSLFLWKDEYLVPIDP